MKKIRILDSFTMLLKFKYIAIWLTMARRVREFQDHEILRYQYIEIFSKAKFGEFEQDLFFITKYLY